MLYRKLKRVWSHNDMNYIPNFKETFPELNHLSREEMCNRWCDLGIEFYTQKQTPVKFWIRFTLPFAIIFMLLMLIGLPFYFFISGQWGYPFKKKNIIFNWFVSLRLYDY